MKHITSDLVVTGCSDCKSDSGTTVDEVEAGSSASAVRAAAEVERERRSC